MNGTEALLCAVWGSTIIYLIFREQKPKKG